MELRDIEYFAVVAEHGNVRRAAEALELSPPALSKSLRRLEKSVGAKLVRRTPKGVELTAVGSAMVDQVRRIRLTLEDAARQATDLSQGRAGHLRIGVGPTIPEELPRVYSALVKDAPGLTLDIIVTDNDETVPSLLKGELDIVYNVLPSPPYKGTVQERLFEDDWVVCASANHPLLRRGRITVADLKQESWALSSVNLLPQYPLLRAFQDNGLPPPRVAVQTRSLRLRLLIWSSSNLLGFASRRVMRHAAPQFRLKEISVKELTWRRPVGVIYREGGYLSPAARRLIEILKATAKEMAAEKR
jgi:DNA-binding transcriptional LysR family regulator